MQDSILLTHPVRLDPNHPGAGHLGPKLTAAVATGRVSTGTGRLRNGNPPGDLCLAPFQRYGQDRPAAASGFPGGHGVERRIPGSTPSAAAFPTPDGAIT